MDYENIGNLISSLRKEKGLTQKELADKLGITDRAISKWERGLGCPDISLLDDLSRILDISILEILKGRKLDKYEKINNESIIESMNYSKESVKNRLKKHFNNISIVFITIISLILVISNLKSMYYLNKTYYDYNLYSYDKGLLKEIENNTKTIKNKKGIYSDEDYNKILSFINKLEKNLKEQNNLYYISKNKYTYYDLVKFYNSHHEFLYFQNNETIYDVIYKYDPSIVKNIVSYNRYMYSLIESNSYMSNQLLSPYYNNKSINKEIVVSIQSFIDLENIRDNMLLKDIIKVGEINE